MPPASSTQKKCGGCNLCCKVPPIAALNKPAGQWCIHCEVGVGCQIYANRPAGCREFSCLWLSDLTLGPEWRPDLARFFLSSYHGNQLAVLCDPGYPLAWRREPYYRKLRDWSAVARRQGKIVLAYAEETRTLIAPEGDFYLGEVKPQDEILTDFTGSYLFQVRVVTPIEGAPGSANERVVRARDI